MQELPETRLSLLVRVQRHDPEAWAEFSRIYRPAIYRIARRHGWQDADAQDIAQQVLVKVADAVERFQPDRTRARFRTWLTTVCRRTLVDQMRRKQADIIHDRATINDKATMNDRATPRDHTTCGPIDPAVSESELVEEHDRQVFRWAAAQAAESFTSSTWSAFWQTAVENLPVQRVAKELGISVGAVYTARSRVMQFLKRKVQQYDDAQM